MVTNTVGFGKVKIRNNIETHINKCSGILFTFTNSKTPVCNQKSYSCILN